MLGCTRSLGSQKRASSLDPREPAGTEVSKETRFAEPSGSLVLKELASTRMGRDSQKPIKSMGPLRLALG